MNIPKKWNNPLSVYERQWLYIELVLRFAKYKQPIKTVNSISKLIHVQPYEIIGIISQGSALKTDGIHIWNAQRCEKLNKLGNTQ